MNFEQEKTKSLQIAEILEKEIREEELIPGARIRSVRKLSGQFAVSIKVIQDAFQLLETKKLIECRHGSGTFVRKGQDGPLRRVAFLFKTNRNIEESYHFQVFQQVCRKFQAEGFVVDLTAETEMEKIRANYASVVISSTIGNDVIADLTAGGIPCAVYGKVTGLKNICEIYPDYFQGSQLAVDYLVKCGYTRIYFIQAENEDNRRSQVCLEGYLQGMKRNGMASDPRSVYRFSQVDSLLQKIKRDASKIPPALYIPNDATAYDINNRLRALGVKVPAQVALMGFYNRSHAVFAHPALTTIGFDHGAIGKITAEKLLGIMNGQPEESAQIPVEVIERESVKKINESSLLLTTQA
ncbi:MAG: Arabinose metabolism transcriptional repressor [Lentisphaerae bacterium ADurb.Bin242]|nr:MAG: Arabinose metabolism transcriptional repressor [Lentisphaerae bacterium ADurb.Bin242]